MSGECEQRMSQVNEAINELNLQSNRLEDVCKQLEERIKSVLLPTASLPPTRIDAEIKKGGEEPTRIELYEEIMTPTRKLRLTNNALTSLLSRLEL